MTEPKLHHYVPQFHLRRFADVGGKVWVWERDLDRAFRTAPANIAAETQFYRVTELEQLGHDPLTMEKQLSALEGQVATITAQWLDWLPRMAEREVLPIPSENRDLIALHIAVQLLRTADAREILAALANVDARAHLSAGDRRKLHVEMMWDDELVRSLAERFSDSLWIFAVNTSGIPYLTSDNPIAFRTADNRQWVKAGILAPGVYVVFPLSPTIMMYAYPKDHPSFDVLAKFADCRSPVTVEDGMVESENSGQVFMASRFVIADRDDFAAARAFALTIGTDTYADIATFDR